VERLKQQKEIAEMRAALAAATDAG
jgi:hypothetical protein